MLSHACEAVSLIEGKTRTDLDRERLLNLALVRLLEIVGEAANRVSSEGQMRWSGIPWPQIVGMRNRLIHGYDFVDFDILWQTVVEDVPNLITLLETILHETNPDNPPLP